jgi:NADPH-dependent 2,4-dienoyl-CoA reductase/sulfur reductase-like enzyme/rhodanese-related sulfurtransferase
MSGASRQVVIVGASAAGLRCACRLVRLRPEWQVTVVEAGEVFSYGACGLPYVLSGDIDALDDLRRTSYGALRDADYFARVKGVTVRPGWRAVAVDAERQTLRVVTAEGPVELEWDELVLATGGRARRLPGQPDHPRIRTFHVWDDVVPLKQALAHGEIGRVAVVGAGLVGCELTEAFGALWGADVVLVEASSSVLPTVLDPEAAALVQHHLSEQGVTLCTGAPVCSVEAADGVVVITTESERIETDAAVIAVGVEPVVDLALSAGAILGSSGAIAVDERLSTSVPHVWAVGDCAEIRHRVTGDPGYLPLGSLANRQGRTLANVLAGENDLFPPAVGAVAVKVFDLDVAATGCTLAAARSVGFDARAVWLTGEDRAGYWPEVEEIFLTLVYDPASRQVLGVQAVGRNGVAKRIDVATQLVAYRARLEEVAHLEHAYAPPYAPALDPLAVAAMAALNQEQGTIAVSPLADLDGCPVLDVRLAEERSARPLEASRLVAMEIGQVRERGRDDLPEAGTVVVCERGTRSAEVAGWVGRHGGSARYLGGGMAWRTRAVSAETRVPTPALRS